ncbi:MAG: hypothetical protein A2W25_03750 [candidate division Zixibacteria bacterium RBG_16_53_22]|nr:MAG: hypothetical protein A2W25_03750 [candidate division Zixibacteria bacterium RBG_16_53_22]
MHAGKQDEPGLALAILGIEPYVGKEGPQEEAFFLDGALIEHTPIIGGHRHGFLYDGPGFDSLLAFGLQGSQPSLKLRLLTLELNDSLIDKLAVNRGHIVNEVVYYLIYRGQPRFHLIDFIARIRN